MKKFLENKKQIITLLIVLVIIFGTFNYFFGGEGKFVRTGDMVVPRFAHSAVLLKDGRVLITGGYYVFKTHLKKEYSKSAEIYDPKTGKFTRTSDMIFPREYHSSILLNDGRVLILGGGRAEAEIYNPNTGKFSITGKMPIIFLDEIGNKASLIRLKNGDVIIVDSIFKDNVTWIIKYSVNKGVFNLIKKTKLGHDPQKAILLQNGNILIVGGYTLLQAEIYNPNTNESKLTNNENDIVGDFLATPIDKNKKVLLIKNYENNVNTKLFNIENNTFQDSRHSAYWSSCKGICTATLLQNGKVLILGINKTKQKLYDPIRDKFINTKRVKLNDFDHTATLLQNGNVLITGGMVPWTITTSSNKAFLYKH